MQSGSPGLNRNARQALPYWLLLVLIAVGASALVFKHNARIVQERHREQLSIWVTQHITDFTRDLERAGQAALALSRQPVIRAAMRDDVSGIQSAQAVVLAVADSDVMYRRIRLVTDGAPGIERIHVKRSDDSVELISATQERSVTDDDPVLPYKNLGATLVAYSTLERSGVNRSGSGSEEWTIRAYAPVLAVQGKVSGYVVIDAEITDAIRRLSSPPPFGAKLYLAQADGMVIVDSTYKPDQTTLKASSVGSASFSVIDEFRIGEGGGSQVFRYVLQEAQDTGNAEIWRRSATLIAVVALSAIVAGLSVYSFFRRRYSPLAELVTFAGAIGEGNFRATPPSVPNTDFRRVSHALVQMRDALSRRERMLFFDAVMTAVPAALLIVDRQGSIRRINPRASRMFGYADDELVGKSIDMLVPKSFRDTHVHHRDAYGKSPRVQAMAPGRDLFGAKKNGALIPVNVALSPLTIQGETYVTATVHDLTEYKRTAAELAAAKDRAEAANRAKSSFLANMSHEIRTPLNGMLGIAQLLRDTPLSSRQREDVEQLLNSGRTLLRVLNGILDFSRIEADRLELTVKPFDLDALCDETLALFSSEADQKGVELLLDIDPITPSRLIADDFRLAQVLNNLVGNAVKFTDRGQVLLKISGTVCEDETVTLHFSVRDTGIGMTADQLEQLFQPFHQADTSTQRRFGGTGLGLVIAQRIIEKMGSRIEVISTYGDGTTFSFSLNVEKEEGLHPSRLRNKLGQMRALVVDDNTTSQQIVSGLLMNWGLDIACCSSASCGLEKMIEADQWGKPYDLVILDWKMPEIDGIGMLREIDLLAKKTGSKKPEVIMVTAFDNAKLERAAEQHKVRTIINKPISPSRLYDAIAGIQHEINPDWLIARLTQVDEVRSEVADIKGCHVLVVEDHPTNQYVAKSFLERMDIQVDVADNGRIAIDMATANEYDAILMDLQMPVMDGITAAKLLREIPKYKDSPIIAMTAAATEEDRANSKAAGMNDHLAKPVNVKDLAGVLIKWIDPSVVQSRHHDFAKSAAMEPATNLMALLNIDVETALRRLDGDWTLLRKVLTDFENDFADANTRITEALASGNLDSAIEQIQIIRGMASNIGARPLANSAAALEQQLATDVEEVEKLRLSVDFVANLEAVLGDIASLRIQNDATKLLDIQDSVRIGALKELGVRLRQSTFIPQRNKDRVKDLLLNRVDNSLISELIEHITRLDYEESERTLDIIVRQIEDT